LLFAERFDRLEIPEFAPDEKPLEWKPFVKEGREATPGEELSFGWWVY
jgi:hypothetical protein